MKEKTTILIDKSLSKKLSLIRNKEGFKSKGEVIEEALKCKGWQNVKGEIKYEA